MEGGPSLARLNFVSQPRLLHFFLLFVLLLLLLLTAIILLLITHPSPSYETSVVFGRCLPYPPPPSYSIPFFQKEFSMLNRCSCLLAAPALRRSLVCAAARPFCCGSAGAALLASAAARSPFFASSMAMPRRFAGDAALADVARRELDEEAHRSSKPEEPAVPAGWTVERAPHSSTFLLRRTYEDESILIRYTPTENTDVNYHELTVFITRQGGRTLQVGLSLEEGEIVLDSITYHHDGLLAMNESAEAEVQRSKLYPGPKVSELDDTMMDAFIKYLEKRGISQELGEFVSLYSFWAEQQEYELWLKNLHDFVAA